MDINSKRQFDTLVCASIRYRDMVLKSKLKNRRSSFSKSYASFRYGQRRMIGYQMKMLNNNEQIGIDYK